MFTGIIKGRGTIQRVTELSGASQVQIELPEGAEHGLELGASVSVDGVCLTVTKIDGRIVDFDIVLETLNRSSLGSLTKGDFVNIERAARDNAEIGGHPISGHVDCTAKIVRVTKPDNNCVLTLQVPSEWMRYIFPKGYIALNGASLTVTNIHKIEKTFDVWLIPETLRLTTFGTKEVDDLVNLEIERGTQVAVDTMRDFLEEKFGRFLPAFEEALGKTGISVEQIAGEGRLTLFSPK